MSDIVTDRLRGNPDIYIPKPDMAAIILRSMLQMVLLGEADEEDARGDLKKVWLASPEYQLEQDEQTAAVNAESLHFKHILGSVGFVGIQPVVMINESPSERVILRLLDNQEPAFSISVPDAV